MKGSCRKLGAGGYRETIFIGRPLSTWLRPCVGGYFVYSQWSPARVDPMHAKKMAAEMQAEGKKGTSRTRPILLRIESKAGHGAGKPVTKQIEELTDVYSFLFWQMGIKE